MWTVLRQTLRSLVVVVLVAAVAMAVVVVVVLLWLSRGLLDKAGWRSRLCNVTREGPVCFVCFEYVGTEHLEEDEEGSS